MIQDMALPHSELHSLVGVIKEVHKELVCKQSVARASRGKEAIPANMTREEEY